MADNTDKVVEVVSEWPHVNNIERARMDAVGERYIKWVRNHSSKRWDSDSDLAFPPWYQIIAACGRLGLMLEDIQFGNNTRVPQDGYFATIGFLFLNSYLWWADSFGYNCTMSEFMDDSNAEIAIKWEEVCDDSCEYPVLFEVLHAVSEMDKYELRHALVYLWWPMLIADKVDVVKCCEIAMSNLPIIVKDALPFYRVAPSNEVN